MSSISKDSPTVIFAGRALELRIGENLLDGLARHGIRWPSSCRIGICRACQAQGTGDIPSEAREGLSPVEVRAGAFLPCQCQLAAGMRLEMDPPAQSFSVAITRVAHGAGISRLWLQKPPGFSYEAGQHVNVELDGLQRPYSFASLPAAPEIELHIRILPDGALSPRLGALQPGQALTLGAVHGKAVASQVQDAQEPILLAGTGTGLAPLWSILQQLLAQGHAGPITVLHGGRSCADLYLDEELRSLARRQPDILSYRPALSRELSGLEPADCFAGRLTDLLPQVPLDASRLRAFLCGHPEVVQSLRRALFLKGASMARLHADPFVHSGGTSRA